MREGIEPAKRAIALTCLLHLVGDIHQPLHTVQLFTRDYPSGDRGGNEICVRVALARAPLNPHRLWDGLITSGNNLTRLRDISAELRDRFPRSGLTELDSTEPEAWARESFEIATKIAYQNGNLRGTPKGQRKDCREATDAAVLPTGYPAIAGRIAVRRIVLAGYRLMTVLERISGK